HHAGPSPSATTRHEGWGLLPGHQWGPRPGHQWGLSHGHGHQWWVISRLVSWPIVYLPAQLWPLATYLVACLIATLGMATVLQSRAAALFGPFPLRVVLFFVLIAQPLAFEIQGSLANVHVWMAMALLVIL